jgi:hypothetical protein
MMTKENKMMNEREEILLTISDLSKDAFGSRMRLDYDAMSDADGDSVWDVTVSLTPGEIGRASCRERVSERG